MADDERYGVTELADAADVSVRTVRYYIAEGLLPPPVTAGARSYYMREHLDRLRVIGRMKDAYLPLREIRRQLATLDEAAIKQLADEAVVVDAELDAEDASYDLQAPPAFVTGREEIRAAHDAPASEPPLHSSQSGQLNPASEYIARVLGRPVRRQRAHPAPATVAQPPTPPAVPELFAAEPEPEPLYQTAAEPAAWRRIPIGDDAELLIREDAYHRRRDKIDWLIDWARKVLG